MDIMHLSAVEGAVRIYKVQNYWGLDLMVWLLPVAHIDFHKETVYQVLLTERQVTHALSVLKEYHMPVARRTGVCM